MAFGTNPDGYSLQASHLTLTKGDKVIVHDVGFEIQSNAFVGILGPSGAGKTTLLNCLAGYLIPQQGGELRFDGTHDVQGEIKEYRTWLGYVTQDDVVFSLLTTSENMIFAALLQVGIPKWPAWDTSLAEWLIWRVDEQLREVGLGEGDCSKRVDKLSGGQRKRLSVAVELLKRPRLLLLDEPTSGLDPANVATRMDQFRLLARQGTTVICTTHVMQKIDLFDSVIVLGVQDRKGCLAYVGPPAQLLTHFECQDFAELYECLETGRFTPQRPTVDRTMSLPATDPDHASDRPATLHRPQTNPPLPPVHLPSDQPRPIRDLVSPSMASQGSLQTLLLTFRALLLIGRDRRLLVTMMAQPIVLGLLICLTQFSPGMHISPILFFTVAVAIWLGMNNSVRDLVRERKQYLRERLKGLRPSAYLGSKLAAYVLIGIVQLCVLWLVVRGGTLRVIDDTLAKELREFSFWWTTLMLLFAYVGGLGLGLGVSAIARSEDTAVAALPLLIMPQLLLSVVATGQVNESWEKSRLFRPLVVTLHCENRLQGFAPQMVEIFSMLCLSRPATLTLERPSLSPGISGFARWIWLGDLCHLLLLVFLIWTGVFLLFHWAEQGWPRLIGLG